MKHFVTILTLLICDTSYNDQWHNIVDLAVFFFLYGKNIMWSLTTNAILGKI